MYSPCKTNQFAPQECSAIRPAFGEYRNLWYILHPTTALGGQAMNANSILQGKSTKVFDVKIEASLQQAAQLMDDKRIGAVLVRGAKQEICGVLSERDVSRQVARKGSAALDRPVGECMSRKVITVQPNTSLDDLMNIMTDRRIRHLPVVDGDQLLGMISIGDVVKHKINEAEAEAEAMYNYIAAG